MTQTAEPNRKKTRAQRQKLADLIPAAQCGEMTIREAMLQAGYSESQAAKGWSKVPQAVIKMLPQNMKQLIALGKRTSPDDMRALVHGRLVSNVAEGSDKGAQSSKVLGSSRDLNMWTPDMQMGLVVIQTPRDAIEHKTELLASLKDED